MHLPNISYLVSKDNYEIDFTYLANSLALKSDTLEMVNYWLDWVSAKNYIDFEIDPLSSFKKITEYPEIKPFNDSYLLCGYSVDEEQ